jgi:hypothetical protein
MQCQELDSFLHTLILSNGEWQGSGRFVTLETLLPEHYGTRIEPFHRKETAFFEG